ncbi:unnamed protein product [Macrosiphum euphorbiae]|uniref:Uncharacterized protein n=1 Tax=Macrosiphum euphorbiae TaxID=13131 RepID=A0AAV0X7M8_9HEMI|nr:unnamed protein product [Macrosiphum euphorbiae]
MSFYRTRERIDYSYAIIDNAFLFAGNEITDLGIVFDSVLNVHHAHLDNMCCKTLKTLDLIKRICNAFKQVTPMKFLCCAFVRQFWSMELLCGIMYLLWDESNLTCSMKMS